MDKLNINYKGLILFILSYFLIRTGIAQTTSSPKVIIQYKKNEFIDLGNLEIKGEILAPGDISVMERKKMRVKSHLFTRPNFSKEIKNDIYYLR
jgi:hypothetical protein